MVISDKNRDIHRNYSIVSIDGRNTIFKRCRLSISRLAVDEMTVFCHHIPPDKINLIEFDVCHRMRFYLNFCSYLYP